MQLLVALLKACSKDPCIFVAEKQTQGTEGRSGKTKKRQINNLKTLKSGIAVKKCNFKEVGPFFNQARII